MTPSLGSQPPWSNSSTNNKRWTIWYDVEYVSVDSLSHHPRIEIMLHFSYNLPPPFSTASPSTLSIMWLQQRRRVVVNSNRRRHSIEQHTSLIPDPIYLIQSIAFPFRSLCLSIFLFHWPIHSHSRMPFSVVVGCADIWWFTSHSRTLSYGGRHAATMWNAAAALVFHLFFTEEKSINGPHGSSYASFHPIVAGRFLQLCSGGGAGDADVIMSTSALWPRDNCAAQKPRALDSIPSPVPANSTLFLIPYQFSPSPHHRILFCLTGISTRTIAIGTVSVASNPI